MAKKPYYPRITLGEFLDNAVGAISATIVHHHHLAFDTVRKGEPCKRTASRMGMTYSLFVGGRAEPEWM